MSTQEGSIKLLKATVDVIQLGPGKETVVIRGVIDPESLARIKVAPYQREVIPGEKMKELREAVKISTVPDIELGMRGGSYRVHDVDGENCQNFFLKDPVYVIDGLQRVSAAMHVMSEDSSIMPRIGALVHIDTDEKWEGERFRILNQDRLKLNSNILLRNARTSSDAMDMIYRLTQDDTFVLATRVQWSQRKARTEIMTAIILCHTVGYLHSRFGPGRAADANIVVSLDKTMKIVGRTTMRDNLKTFFDILDECYGIKRIVYGHSVPILRRTFLVSLADVFTSHTDFWRGHRLFIEKSMRAKLAKFPVNDPEVARLACSGGQAKEILFQLMLKHLNSGKRTRRLTLVDGVATKDGVDVPELTDEGAGK